MYKKNKRGAGAGGKSRRELELVEKITGTMLYIFFTFFKKDLNFFLQ